MRNDFDRIVDRILADDFPQIDQTTRDAIIDRVVPALLEAWDRDGQRHRWIGYTEEGNPCCTWCGAMPGPRLSSDHPQYGIFCTCTEPSVNIPDVIGEAS